MKQQGVKKFGIHGNNCPHCLNGDCECLCKVCSPLQEPREKIEIIDLTQTKMYSQPEKTEIEEQITEILKLNFTPFVDKDMWGKSEVDIKCEIIAKLISSLFQSKGLGECISCNSKVYKKNMCKTHYKMYGKPLKEPALYKGVKWALSKKGSKIIQDHVRHYIGKHGAVGFDTKEGSVCAECGRPI